MSSENKHLVLVIGAGPAGLFAANKLAEAGNKVVILNRDIKYGGLAEYGIFVSKHKMKEGLRKQFRKVISHPNVEYLGNVTVGKEGNLSIEELQEIGFDAVVVSAGAQGTKKVGIPGEEAKGIYHAKDVVYHYNHLPPFSEKPFPVGKSVAIIGVGNVMVDIAHWLVHYKKVERVIAVARRGPNERAYTDKEMQAIAFNMDKENVKAELERIRPHLEAVGQNVETTYQEITKDCDKPYHQEASPSKFSFKFLCAPKRVLTNENNEVIGLEVEENKLTERDGKISAKSLGTTQVLDVDNVVFAIGDRVDASIGLPVNEWGEFVKNEKAYEDSADAHLYELYDPEKDSVVKGIFVMGWSRKASDGLVGIAKKDGETGTRHVLRYLESVSGSVPVSERLEKFQQLLKGKNILSISKQDIEILEEVEKKEAENRGLEFFKFDFNSEMLEVIQREKNKVTA